MTDIKGRSNYKSIHGSYESAVSHFTLNQSSYSEIPAVRLQRC